MANAIDALKARFSKLKDDLGNSIYQNARVMSEVGRGIGRDISNNPIVKGNVPSREQQLARLSPSSRQDAQKLNTQYANMSPLNAIKKATSMSYRLPFISPTSPEYQNLTTEQQVGSQAPKFLSSMAGVNPLTNALTSARGLVGVGATLGIGGGINKAMGGSFAQGVKGTAETLPSIYGIGQVSNPLIANTASRLSGKLANPIAQSIANRTATGLANIPEGVVMSGGLNQPYSVANAGLDFGTGFLFGSGVDARSTVGKNNLSSTKRIDLTYKLPNGTKKVLKNLDEGEARGWIQHFNENGIKFDSKVKQVKGQFANLVESNKNTDPLASLKNEARKYKSAGETFYANDPLKRGQALKALDRKVYAEDGKTVITKKQWVEGLFDKEPDLKIDKSALTGQKEEKWWIGDWETTKAEADYYKHLQSNHAQLTDIYNQAKGVEQIKTRTPLTTKVTDLGGGSDEALASSLAHPYQSIQEKIDGVMGLGRNENFIKLSKVEKLKAIEQFWNPSERDIDLAKVYGFEDLPTAKDILQKIDNQAKGEASKYAFNINKQAMGTSKEANKVIDEAVNQVRPILEENKGKPLSHKEVIKKGKSASMLNEVMTRDQTAEFTSRLQALRNQVKSQSESQGITQEYLDNLVVLSSIASDTGRKLNAFSIGAEDVSLKQKVVKDLLDFGVEANKIVEGAKNVDWNNAKQVTEFYRKFKPAKLNDYLTEFRYTNMLSSPLTHVVNTFSNILQGGVIAPIEKTITGGLGYAYSKLTGKEQQYFARQGIDYTKGYFKAIPEAFDAFKKTFTGGAEMTKPDVEMIPTTTNKIWSLYKTPLTALEASDQFFRKLVKGGELESLKRQGIIGSEAQDIATKKADYRLFRQAFDPEGKLGQGKVLQVWDKWNSAINNLRRVPGGKWIIPFLQTPTNILKQGVEYSPLGVTTMIGAKEPMEQLSKSIIGTTVFATAYGLANAGLTTWDAPTNAKEKEEFYSAGLQPYSIKIGDKWVSYSKLGPLSYPFAMASALKWAGDNGAEEDVMTKLGNGVGGSLQFFADQSYVRGIGDMIDALRGDEYKQSRALANIPMQTIPYESLQGWITRIIDPVYRKTSGESIPEAIKSNIMAKTPGLSSQLPAYETPFGEPSQRQYPLVNAVSPLSVTKENPMYKDYYEARQGERIATKELNTEKKSAKEALKGTTISTQGKRTFYRDGTSVMTLDIPKLMATPKNEIERIRNEKDRFEQAVKIFRADGPTQEEKNNLISQLKIKPQDIAYYDIASDTAEVRRSAVDMVMNRGYKDRAQMLLALGAMRYEVVSGKRVLADTTIDDLYNDGLISYAEKKYLKDVKFEKNKQPRLKSSKSSGGRKPKLPQLKVSQISAPSFAQIKPISVSDISRVSLPQQPRINLDSLKIQARPQALRLDPRIQAGL